MGSWLDGIGLIHLLVLLLLPTLFSFSADIVCERDDLSTLCDLLDRFDLDDALDTGTWTLFAPNNEAFGRFQGDASQEILLFHAVGGSGLREDELVCNGALTMANGMNSTTICDNNDVPNFQRGAGNTVPPPTFLETDIGGCDESVVHIMDDVMLFE